MFDTVSVGCDTTPGANAAFGVRLAWPATMWWYLLVAPTVLLLSAVVAVVFVVTIALVLVSLVAFPILIVADVVMMRLPSWVRGR